MVRFPLGVRAGVLVAALGIPVASALAGPSSIGIGGSSTVFPIMQQALQHYRASHSGAAASFSLQESGTTAGFREFCQGRLAVANASRPINAAELQSCRQRGVRFIELPIAFDAITVVVHPRNSWAGLISTQELRRLWNRAAEGRIQRWNQVNADWPDRPIRLCGPGRDSGTYDYFNKAINGEVTDSRRDYTASEDDQVLVRCVASDPDALGYFGYAYFDANRSRLKPLMVVGKLGPVAPTPQTVQQQRYLPLSRPLFIYVNDQNLRSQSELRRFVTGTVQSGLRLVRQARYIPLPSDTYRLVEAKLYRHVLGSAFGGELPVGQSLSDSLRRSLEAVRKTPFR